MKRVGVISSVTLSATRGRGPVPNERGRALICQTALALTRFFEREDGAAIFNHLSRDDELFDFFLAR